MDLAGGTLDLWPLGLLQRGARTVNVAVDLPVEVELRPLAAGFRVQSDGEQEIREADTPALRRRPETALLGVVFEELALPAVAVTLKSASPRGAGLGASSALTVALLAAGERLRRDPPSPAAALAARARDLEARLMALPTGLQDHYPALLGGVLDLAHAAGRTEVNRLPVDLAALGACLVVAYSGASHFSAGQNWQIYRGALEGDRGVNSALERIGEVASALRDALLAADLASVGELMGEEGKARRTLAPGIATPAIENLLATALRAGAWGGKACGAGGGGSIAVLCPPGRRAAVEAALAAAGATLLAAPPTSRALELFEVEP